MQKSKMTHEPKAKTIKNRSLLKMGGWVGFKKDSRIADKKRAEQKKETG